MRKSHIEATKVIKLTRKTSLTPQKLMNLRNIWRTLEHAIFRRRQKTKFMWLNHFMNLWKITVRYHLMEITAQTIGNSRIKPNVLKLLKSNKTLELQFTQTSRQRLQGRDNHIRIEELRTLIHHWKHEKAKATRCWEGSFKEW